MRRCVKMMAIVGVATFLLTATLGASGYAAVRAKALPADACDVVDVPAVQKALAPLPVQAPLATQPADAICPFAITANPARSGGCFPGEVNGLISIRLSQAAKGSQIVPLKQQVATYQKPGITVTPVKGTALGPGAFVYVDRAFVSLKGVKGKTSFQVTLTDACNDTFTVTDVATAATDVQEIGKLLAPKL